jgi:hypothetical protein
MRYQTVCWLVPVEDDLVGGDRGEGGPARGQRQIDNGKADAQAWAARELLFEELMQALHAAAQPDDEPSARADADAQ